MSFWENERLLVKYLWISPVYKCKQVWLYRNGKVCKGMFKWWQRGWISKHGRALNMDLCYILSSVGKKLGWSKGLGFCLCIINQNDQKGHLSHAFQLASLNWHVRTALQSGDLKSTITKVMSCLYGQNIYKTKLLASEFHQMSRGKHVNVSYSFITSYTCGDMLCVSVWVGVFTLNDCL